MNSTRADSGRDSATLSPGQREAEQSGADGRHKQGLAQLQARARQGDLQAMTRLGKRLIVGDHAPSQPREGVGLIVKAAEQHGPEALAVLSVFFALGMYMKQSWRSALNSLRLAAERGWEPAREQLKVLAMDRQRRDAPPDESDHWLKLAGSVDLAYWHSAPPARTLHHAPLIRSFPAMLDPGPCRWLMNTASRRLERARVYDSVAAETTTSHTRTNSSAIFNLIDTDLVNLLLQMRMAACTGIGQRHCEAATVLHYAVGQQISPHFDFIDPLSPNYEQQIARAGQRVITFLVYLNDDYQGGETEFVELGLRHRGCAGEGLFFVNTLSDGNPDRRTLHAGRPIVAGEKWIASQFICNRPTF